MITLFIVGLNLCVLVFVVAHIAVGGRPNGARLALCFTCAGVGGVAAFLLFAFTVQPIDRVVDELAGFLVKQGLPKRASEWLLIYIASGFVIAGMAAGAGLGWWWLMREKAK